MQILVNSLLKFLNRYKYFDEVNNELLPKVVFELKIKRQSGFQESPRFHQRIVKWTPSQGQFFL
jgi:hypothetical protein